LKAAQAAKIIWGQFRRSDTDDPEVFYPATKALLSRYPEAIVMALCDPQNGIAGEQTFLPSIAEMRASLDRRMAPILAEQAKRQRFAETERLLKAPAKATAEERARAVEAWERQRAEVAGRKNTEEDRLAAEKRVSELYRESLEPRTVTIGPGLAAKLDSMKGTNP
jgi:hypothetical protein